MRTRGCHTVHELCRMCWGRGGQVQANWFTTSGHRSCKQHLYSEEWGPLCKLRPRGCRPSRWTGSEWPSAFPLDEDPQVGLVYSVTRYVRPTKRGMATLCEACLHSGVDALGAATRGGGIHLCAYHRAEMALADEDGVTAEEWVAAGFLRPVSQAVSTS